MHQLFVLTYDNIIDKEKVSETNWNVNCVQDREESKIYKDEYLFKINFKCGYLYKYNWSNIA